MIEYKNMNIDEATKKFIDSLKQTCGSFGLGNDGNEYKIIIQVFLYKYFNDKFGYEAKRTNRFGERLRNAERCLTSLIFFQQEPHV